MLNFDPFLFAQIGLDSGALTMLGAVVHSAPKEGVYQGNVLQAGSAGAAFELQVTKESAASQVNIDLTMIGTSAGAGSDCGCRQGSEVLQVHPKGTLVFHVSKGAGGYAVVLASNESSAEQAVFDSRKLQPGDMFAASVLRPGSYRAESGRARCEFSVAYPPAAGQKKYSPPENLQVNWLADRAEPSNFRLASGQGVLFKVEAPDTRIVITLEQADDGPSGAVRKRSGLRILPRK